MEASYIFMAQAGFAILTFLCLALVLFGTRVVYQKMGMNGQQANNRLFIFIAILVVWLSFISLLAWKGVLSDFSTFPPKIALLLFPTLVIIVALTFNRKFKNFLLHVPPQWLIYLQTFRFAVEIFLWWLFLGHAIPRQMTFEGRNFDILSGILAPIFAWLCYGSKRHNRPLTFVWNLLGMGLLLNIVLTALLSLPTPLRVFLNSPDSSFITTFPTVFLPTILVPLAYSLHFFSFRKLWLERKSVIK